MKYLVHVIMIWNKRRFYAPFKEDSRCYGSFKINETEKKKSRQLRFLIDKYLLSLLLFQETKTKWHRFII